MHGIEKRLRAPLVAGVLAICSCLLVGYSTLLDRSAAIENAQRSNRDAARIVASQVEESIRAVDILADDVIARIPREAMTSLESLRAAIATPAFHGLLENRKDRMPDADVITIVGSDGMSIVTTRGWPTPWMNSSGGIHFQNVSQHPGPQLQVSTTIFSKVSGSGIVYFSRRIETPSGDFIGYVTTGMARGFYEKFNNSFAQIPGGFVRLIRNDGYVISGNADSEESIVTKRIPATNEWHRLIRSGGGTTRVVGADSKIARYVAVQPLANYPISISVGVQEARILEQWWSQAVPRAMGQLVLAAFISGLIFFLYLLYIRSQESKIELARRSSELEASYKRLNLLLSNMTHGVTMFDENQRLLVISDRCFELYGIERDQIKPGMSWEEVRDITSKAGVLIGDNHTKLMRTTASGKQIGQQTFVIQTTAHDRHIAVTRAMTNRGGWISVHEDVTERENSARRIERLARYDTLTGLANRALFIEQMTDLFSRGDARPIFVLMLLDLDEFKAVNDSFGHPTGDQLLVSFAERLRAGAPDDLIARVGGDEFVILRVLQEGDEHSIPHFIETLLASTRLPYGIEGHEIKVGLSIGAALATREVRTTEEILRQADFALYKAKQDGRNGFRIFNCDMESEIQSRRELARDLDAALVAGEIMVYFQPIVDAKTLDVRAMEALCRWRHPTRGFVPPNLFIPVAEEAGLIGALGQYVMASACRTAATWPKHVHLSVNVSPIQLARPDFMDMVKDALNSSGLAASRLEMEITESVLLDHHTHNRELLGQLHDLGIGISLDDFGTGYSSLSYLDRFAFDKIKIDRSFVMRLGDSSGISTIISAVSLISKAYNAQTTAEGVETYEQAQLLRVAGIDNFQGYLFGAPHPAESWIFEDGKVSLRTDKVRSA